ncbi:DUF6473 family protein [Thioclava pacifica]|uniref:DUF6473 domain-containing protein n=1 Tax=Thioclava pacifica DSM 10166 TaxID=1353537 RepID=A0A074JAR8_9RHOB|nr:DUF6473 family protein [Thioclava pacifica]KEO52658.1 hypothetical protein TP2_06880 [Thioclava pacifica DSM 10166]
MAFEYPGDGALDYFPCRYGKSKLLFRGPRRALEGEFIAAMGGTETYGKFVAEPWPALLEAHLGRPVVNFGVLNAGIDVFLQEPQLATTSKAAKLTVIQLLGAQNMSNRFYAVHPRRNDRFLRASNQMRVMFRGIDFTEFNFTRHMLGALKERAPERFEALALELQTSWVQRMKALLAKVEGVKILLWMGDYHMPDLTDPLGPEPLLVSEAMVDELRPHASEVLRVEPTLMARCAGTAGMQFSALEEPAAAMVPGPMVHREIADALAPVVKRYL